MTNNILTLAEQKNILAKFLNSPAGAYLIDYDMDDLEDTITFGSTEEFGEMAYVLNMGMGNVKRSEFCVALEKNMNEYFSQFEDEYACDDIPFDIHYYAVVSDSEKVNLASAMIAVIPAPESEATSDSYDNEGYYADKNGMNLEDIKIKF